MTTAIIEKEKVEGASQVKIFYMLPSNENLFNLFRDGKYPEWETDAKQKASWVQYKSRVGNFLGQLDKSIFRISVKDIETYLDIQPNARNFINGFLLFHIKEDTQGFRTKVTKEVLLYLLHV